MMRCRPLLAVMALLVPALLSAAAANEGPLPRSLDTYPSTPGLSLWEILGQRAQAEPFNVAATAIFALAIVHTFLSSKFRHRAHVIELAHARHLERRRPRRDNNEDGRPDEVSFKGQLYHFLGEIEAVFGLWILPLVAAIVWYHDLDAAVQYLSHRVNFTEPMFVVVIMALAATRPVLVFAEMCLGRIARLGGSTTAAWWFSILTLGPVLGSFITEPAAMTISALLLARQFYALKPSPRLAYGTLGLLFVNISVGGTLTHFAAPPVLMVAAPWDWGTPHMLANFGWKAVVGIIVANAIAYLVFRRELRELDARRQTSGPRSKKNEAASVPLWIIATHLAFIALIVLTAHHPPLFIGLFLFFLAFAQATAHHQTRLALKSAMLVGFFLAGLVVHGGLQAWWIEPTLSRLGEIPLFFGAVALTAVNDNAAITYLATLVPGFTESLKYAVVAGAVTGGGLTVIANAPNPAGQNILQQFFPDGISPVGLLLGAMPPTLVMCAAFLFL
jgi:hypothetical protein